MTHGVEFMVSEARRILGPELLMTKPLEKKTRGTKWKDRAQEITNFILHDGWSLRDLAKHYGVSDEYVRQVVHRLGIPYSARRSCKLPAWPKVNSACGHLDRPYHAKNKCFACYHADHQRARLTDPAKRQQHHVQTSAGIARRKAAKALLDGRWSRAYDCCRECHTTDRMHVGHGYCTNCYQRIYNQKGRVT